MQAIGYSTQTFWWGYIFGKHYSPSAYAASLALPDAAIASFVGHAEPGYLQFWNTEAYSYIKADDGMANKPGENYALNLTPDLWDCRLLVLTGCKTAVAQADIWYRSLTQQAVSKGVDCAVGFTKNIVIKNALAWDYYFWLEAYYGRTAQYSCQRATELTYLFEGSYGYTNYWQIQGNGNITIKPASYGT